VLHNGQSIRVTDMWRLEWRYGQLAVHSLGAIIDDVCLNVGNRQARPFYSAPWIGEGLQIDASLLRDLRGEFPCLPFGVSYSPSSAEDLSWRTALEHSVSPEDGPLDDASDALLHGYSCVAEWHLIERDATSLTLAIEYPQTSPIGRVTRRVRIDPGKPAFEVGMTIEARRDCRRPAGFHPTFRLSAAPRSVRILPGSFLQGFTHPAGPEKGISRAASGATFQRLSAVPLSTGGVAAFDELPFEYDTEEVVLLAGCTSPTMLFDRESHVKYVLDWDREHLPSLLLWMSNRGRRASPWYGRNLCLGVEPVAAAFDLGCRASLAFNPINRAGFSTALQLRGGSATTLSYRLEAQPDR